MKAPVKSGDLVDELRKRSFVTLRIRQRQNVVRASKKLNRRFVTEGNVAAESVISKEFAAHKFDAEETIRRIVIECCVVQVMHDVSFQES
jgi:hypothetical protein